MKSLRVDGRLSFIVLLASQLAATMGFTFVLPFMPIYVQALGVEDAGHAAAWAASRHAPWDRSNRHLRNQP